MAKKLVKAVASWSGGKDGCYACYLAPSFGYEVSFLLTMVSRQFQRSGGHGTEAKLMRLQAEAAGIRMLQQEYAGDNYEEVFKAALTQLKQEGVQALVTGDIYLQEHRDWVERVAGEVRLKAVLPLWGMKPGEVTRSFVGAGFQALVVALQADQLGQEWLGRRVDASFLSELPKGVDPEGERGEFHTFVLDGPFFRKRIEVLETGRVLRDGRWFLDIPRYELREKGRISRSARLRECPGPVPPRVGPS